MRRPYFVTFSGPAGGKDEFGLSERLDKFHTLPWAQTLHPAHLLAVNAPPHLLASTPADRGQLGQHTPAVSLVRGAAHQSAALERVDRPGDRWTRDDQPIADVAHGHRLTPSARTASTSPDAGVKSSSRTTVAILD
jgi:hypothetical protein